jgi:hypothetical protein
VALVFAREQLLLDTRRTVSRHTLAIRLLRAALNELEEAFGVPLHLDHRGVREVTVKPDREPYAAVSTISTGVTETGHRVSKFEVDHTKYSNDG